MNKNRNIDPAKRDVQGDLSDSTMKNENCQ